MKSTLEERNEEKRAYQKRRKLMAELQAYWYDKLTKSGFSDLEWLDQKTGKGQNTPFLRHNLHKFKHLDAEELLQRAEYFTGAAQFSQDFKFPTRLHKYVWQLYIEGISYRDMLPKIRSRGFKRVPSIFWISDHINKLKKQYRLWQLEQPDEPETLQDFLENNDRCF